MCKQASKQTKKERGNAISFEAFGSLQFSVFIFLCGGFTSEEDAEESKAKHKNIMLHNMRVLHST